MERTNNVEDGQDIIVSPINIAINVYMETAIWLKKMLDFNVHNRKKVS